MRGDENNVFVVKIGRNESIVDLKDAIKEKNPQTLRACDTGSLILWNVSIPDDENINLKEDVEKLNLDDADSLQHRQKLAKIFREPLIEDDVHVIAKPPQFPSNGKLYYF